MARLLTEHDVESVLTMEAAVSTIEDTFARLGEGSDVNEPRERVNSPHCRLQYLGGACPELGYAGMKIYNTTREGTRFLNYIIDEETGRPAGLIESDVLGRYRTGAASGVATDHLARPDASRVGIIGTGTQAPTQLEAVAAVRDLDSVNVYSSTPENREAFAETMSERIDADVNPVASAEAALDAVDIVITITSSSEAVFDDDAIDPGVHINAAGSNSLARKELPTRTVVGADRLVVDSKEQAKKEAGDFVTALELGLISWGQVRELGDVVAGYAPGRTDESDVTIFESLGIAVQDVALSAYVLEQAAEADLGESVPLFES